MAITPMEINNKEFKKAFRGYDIDDVDDFLDQVVEDYEKLYKENNALREKLGTISEKLEHYTKIEATLQNTLVLAQGAADQAKANSQKEAELIIKNANDTAQKIIDQAHTEVVKITGQYEKIKQEFQLFKSRYKTFIQTQLDLLSEIDTVPNGVASSSSDDFASGTKEEHSKNAVPGFKGANESSDQEIASTRDLDSPGVFSGKNSDFGSMNDFKPKPADLGGNFDDFDDDEKTTY